MLVTIGLLGGAMLYGDGILTPSISVLSAVEGIKVAAPHFGHWVLPLALAILVGLFVLQPVGTESIGRLFGPVMLVWFATIGTLGAVALARHPEVLWAVDPRHGILYLAGHHWGSLAVLGGVFLALTGSEALYADMGHIGRLPIRLSWFGIALPALLLCYAGQSASLIGLAKLPDNPFYGIIPPGIFHVAIWPLVILATLATVIASQAIITGVFSITRQAIQLGWFPGLNIRQTSDREYGQIYVPVMNWAMMAATLALTYGFGSSANLAGAYGMAVSDHHAADHAAALYLPAPRRRLACGGGDPGGRRPVRGRPRLLLRQPAEGGRGRLRAAAGRRPRVRRDDQLAQRH